MTEKRYQLFMVSLILVICITLTFFSWLSFRKVGGVYLDEMRLSIEEIKRDFLQDTVNNLIQEIDLIRKIESDQYRETIDRHYNALTLDQNSSEADFIAFFKNRFRYARNQEGEQDYWVSLLWDNVSNEILYDPSGVFYGDLMTTMDFLRNELSYFRTYDHGTVTALWGVRSTYIESETKRKVTEKIRSLRYENDSYLWVNEIKNYEGGPQYAIRLVHPNLPETEGMYLSTEIIDQQGNRPYLTELEGIKEHGELFSRYWFKKLNSEDVAEKIAFAKLYKEFDWVIAMGIYIDDLEAYIAEVSVEREKMALMLTSRLLLLLVALVALSLLGVLIIDRLYSRKTTSELTAEINTDPLTGACSRRCGLKMMEQELANYKETNVNSVIMIYDLDSFKLINDTYGHEAGDQVLKKVVEAVRKSIRSTDRIIRWGGDEFILLVKDLKPEELPEFSSKILKAVAELKIPVGDEVIKPTISIGASYFEETDLDYGDALRRADRAMFDAKRSGRNKASVL